MGITTKAAIRGYLEKQTQIPLDTLTQFCKDNGICGYLSAIRELIEEGFALLDNSCCPAVLKLATA